MDIDVRTERGVAVVVMAGELTWQAVPDAQARILPLAQPGCKLVLDLARVPYMSSAGLRLVLVIFRTVAGKGGRVVIAGLSEDLEDTMRLTGFLDFFAHQKTTEAAIAALTA